MLVGSADRGGRGRKTIRTGANCAALDGEGTLVRNIIERRFWNRRTRFYNFGLMKSGKFRTERTIMAGAAGALIPLRPRRSFAVAEELSSVRFAAPWGVRLVSSSSRIYNPEGYHYGSIWPLFTGWASLAAYAAGLPEAGFRHLIEEHRTLQSILRRSDAGGASR